MKANQAREGTYFRNTWTAGEKCHQGCSLSYICTYYTHVHMHKINKMEICSSILKSY